MKILKIVTAVIFPVFMFSACSESEAPKEIEENDLEGYIEDKITGKRLEEEVTMRLVIGEEEREHRLEKQQLWKIARGQQYDVLEMGSLSEDFARLDIDAVKYNERSMHVDWLEDKEEDPKNQHCNDLIPFFFLNTLLLKSIWSNV